MSRLKALYVLAVTVASAIATPFVGLLAGLSSTATVVMTIVVATLALLASCVGIAVGSISEGDPDDLFMAYVIEVIVLAVVAFLLGITSGIMSTGQATSHYIGHIWVVYCVFAAVGFVSTLIGSIKPAPKADK